MLLLIDEPLRGVKKINRPAKIYLNNTNLLHAYCQNSKKGTIRETQIIRQAIIEYIANLKRKRADTPYIYDGDEELSSDYKNRLDKILDEKYHY
jgi:hypothetical protein